MADVADILANLIPGVGNLLGVGAAFKLTKMVVTPARVKLRRKSRCGVSCSLRSSRSVTCLSVSSTVAPGQAACTTMVLMMKDGIFAAAKPVIGQDAGDDGDDHHVDDERAVLERPFGKIEALMALARAGGPSGPGEGLHARSDHDFAGVEPLDTTTCAWSKRATSTFRIDTVFVDGIDNPDRRLLVDPRQAPAGMSMTGASVVCMRRSRSRPAAWPPGDCQADLDLEGPGHRIGLGGDLANMAAAPSLSDRPSASR